MIETQRGTERDRETKAKSSLKMLIKLKLKLKQNVGNLLYDDIYELSKKRTAHSRAPH